MRWRLALAGILAAVAGVLGAVAIAGGEPRRGLQTFSYTTATTTVAGGDQTDAAAQCGGGPVVGGGVDVSPFKRGFEVASSAPEDDNSDPDSVPDDEWEAWANNNRAPATNATLVSHVICGPFIGIDLAYVQSDFAVPNNTTRTGRRRCPAAATVISGGVYLTGGGLGAEVASMGPFDGRDPDRRPDDGFQASASGDREGAQTATVYAICSSNSEVRYVSQERALPKRSLAKATARCPGITSASGGGATVSKPNLKIELSASRPFDSDDPDSAPSNGWSGGAANGTRKPRRLTVTAICVVP